MHPTAPTYWALRTQGKQDIEATAELYQLLAARSPSITSLANAGVVSVHQTPREACAVTLEMIGGHQLEQLLSLMPTSLAPLERIDECVRLAFDDPDPNVRGIALRRLCHEYFTIPGKGSTAQSTDIDKLIIERLQLPEDLGPTVAQALMTSLDIIARSSTLESKIETLFQRIRQLHP